MGGYVGLNVQPLISIMCSTTHGSQGQSPPACQRLNILAGPISLLDWVAILSPLGLCL